MREISTASSEQSAGIARINGEINLMDQSTQQNAALVEESAAAADSLKDEAHKLWQALTVFKTEAGHTKTVHPAQKILR